MIACLIRATLTSALVDIVSKAQADRARRFAAITNWASSLNVAMVGDNMNALQLAAIGATRKREKEVLPCGSISIWAKPAVIIIISAPYLFEKSPYPYIIFMHPGSAARYLSTP